LWISGRSSASALIDPLYVQLEPDITLAAKHLFALSEQMLRRVGRVMPHAGMITEEGEFQLATAIPKIPGLRLTPQLILLLTQEGLRQHARKVPLRAVAVAQFVAVSLDGRPRTRAIQVLFEHKRGLTVALYQPFRKKLFRSDYVMRPRVSLPAKPEVKPWDELAA
jgi:hypothetical protein